MKLESKMFLLAVFIFVGPSTIKKFEKYPRNTKRKAKREPYNILNHIVVGRLFANQKNMLYVLELITEVQEVANKQKQQTNKQKPKIF